MNMMQSFENPAAFPRQGPEEALDGDPTSGWLACQRCLSAPERLLRVRTSNDLIKSLAHCIACSRQILASIWSGLVSIAG